MIGNHFSSHIEVPATDDETYETTPDLFLHSAQLSRLKL